MKNKEPFYNNIEKYIIVALFICMTAIIAVTVFTRFIFDFTFSWAEQMARLMLVWISFAGISWAGKVNVHMKVTAVTLLAKKFPKIIEAILWLGDIITIIYGFYLAYKIGIVLIMVKNQGQILSALPWMPKWIMYLAGVLGMAGLSIRTAQRRFGSLIAYRNKVIGGNEQ